MQTVANVDLRTVAKALKGELCILVITVQPGAIENITVADSVLLHAQGHLGVYRRREIFEVREKSRRFGQTYTSKRLFGSVRRDVGQWAVGILRKHLANRHILGGNVAAFGQKRVVIIACYVGRKLIVVICTACKSEIGATDEHIHIHASLFQHIGNGFYVIGSARGVMLFVTPRVKPAVPHLHAHLGRIGEKPVVHGKAFLHVTAEIQSCDAPLYHSVPQGLLRVTVRGKKRNVDAAADITVAQVGKVLLVVTVIAVLVLALKHDNGASVGAKKRPHLLKKRVKVGVKMRYVLFIHATNLHLLVALQPPGKSAEFPLRANVRPGADYDHKLVFRRLFDEGSNIEPSLKAEFVRLRLMQIPSTIGLNAVESHGSHFLKNIVPRIGHIAKIMHRARHQFYRLSVPKELSPLNFKFHCFHLSRRDCLIIPPFDSKINRISRLAAKLSHSLPQRLKGAFFYSANV